MPNAQMSGVYKLPKIFLEIWYNFGPIHNEKYFFLHRNVELSGMKKIDLTIGTIFGNKICRIYLILSSISTYETTQNIVAREPPILYAANIMFISYNNVLFLQVEIS